MDTDALKNQLLDLDEEVFLLSTGKGPRSTVVIVGGSAFMLHELTRRPATHDIDVLQCDALVSSILSGYPNINNQAAAFVDQIPFNFEDRLIELELPTKAIRFVTPSLEDLAVMKLYAWRPNDIEDITNSAFLDKLDWDLLARLVYDKGEAQASALSRRRYEEMVTTYKAYCKEHRQ